MGSHWPAFQSRTRPCGLAISSGVSCVSGTATTSCRTPRCVAASALNALAMVAKASKSVRVCQGGAIAGLKEFTNGCMSVVLRSCFSYQVAAGRTTSENIVVLVIRKSSESRRSSLPVGASSCQTTSFGRAPSGASVARSESSVPSRCFRKYSLPLPELPRRLARHTVSTRGKFSGASGSSLANRSRPALSSRGTYSPTGTPAASASSASCSGLRSKVGYDGIQPMRADCARMSAVVLPASCPPALAEAKVSAPNAS